MRALDDPEFASVVLKELEFGTRMIVPYSVAENARLEKIRSETLKSMIYSLTTHVLADRLLGDTHTYHYDVPAGPWQYAKEKWAPAWFLRRFPVRYEVRFGKFKIERYATYPDARIKDDELLGKPYLYEKFAFPEEE